MVVFEKHRFTDGANGRGVPLSIALTFFGFALGFYCWAVSVGWNHTIDDRYGWRQTQTALSAYYLVGQPFKLAYETPLYGPPWSVPLEFPLNQYLVARLSTVSGMALESAGRLVGVVFHLSILVPAWLILGSLRVAGSTRFVALGLFLLSPFYLFWSRTFLIESTALFFSVAYLACCLRGDGRHSPAWLTGAAMTGSLAAMIKITTFVAFALAAAVCSIVGYLVAEHRGRLSVFTARMAAIGGIPMAALLWWTQFADTVKMANPFGRTLVSAALKAWNFGTLSQRISIGTWKVILGRPLQLLAPISPWLLWIVVFGLLCFVCWVGRRRFAILGAFLCFFVPSAIFTNLHYVHEYYMYASGVFLLAAVILSIVSLIEHDATKWAGWGICVLMTVASIGEYFLHFWPIQAQDNTASLQVGLQIRAQSAPNAVNIILSEFGDPTHAYFSQRRAFLITGGTADVSVNETLENLRGQTIGGIFVEANNRYPVEKLAAFMREHGLTATGVYQLQNEGHPIWEGHLKLEVETLKSILPP